MSAVNVDSVSVLRRADEPAHFLWQGRLYAVRAVRAHWFEPFPVDGPDQQGMPREATGSELPAIPVKGGDDRTVVPARTRQDEPVPSSHTQQPAGDRELWRVEAAAGRTARSGVFDLCVAWPTGMWTLTQVEEQ